MAEPAAERVYPIVYLDALVVKVRDGYAVRNQACYVAIGVNLDGERDVLGLWFQQTEGAKFWPHVLTDLKTRGVQDILFVCVDGPDRVRGGDRSRIPRRDRPNMPGAPGPLIAEARPGLRPQDFLAADSAQDLYCRRRPSTPATSSCAFAEKWDGRYPTISASWLSTGSRSPPFPGLRPRGPPRDLHHKFHRSLAPPDPEDLQTRGHFPIEDAARKLIFTRDHQCRDPVAACFTGRPRPPSSRSSSVTAYPTLQSDSHYFDTTE